MEKDLTVLSSFCFSCPDLKVDERQTDAYFPVRSTRRYFSTSMTRVRKNVSHFGNVRMANARRGSFSCASLNLSNTSSATEVLFDLEHFLLKQDSLTEILFDPDSENDTSCDVSDKRVEFH